MTGKVPLPGSDRTEPPGSRIAALSPGERFQVSVILRPRSGNGERFPQRKLNQNLTVEQLEAIHGADPADVLLIEEFARQSNLSVDGVYAVHRMVNLAGSASDLMKAFRVDLALYESEGYTFRGHSGPTYVPADLVPVIQAVFGLDNRPFARRPVRPPHVLSPQLTSPAVVNTLPDLIAGYDFPSGANGAGQTIGILALSGGFDANDLILFWQQLGLTTLPVVREVSVDGAGNNPGVNILFDQEVTVDIQIASGVAPGAQIVVYFAPPTKEGMLFGIQAAATDTINAPSVITMSFSLIGSESTVAASDRLAIDQALQDVAARSITLFCASGDLGSTNGVTDGLQHLSFPASSPHVTACGGSAMLARGQAIFEVVWNFAAATAASGGGVSVLFPRPDYQAGSGVPLAQNGFAGRGVPDVAGHAAGFSAVFAGAVTSDAGTSLVAPLWAGLIARINQLRGQRIGFMNDLIYGRFGPKGALNDTLTGDNGFFQAGPGWDACTGLGSPKGNTIFNLLGPPTISSISPTAGPVGGGIIVTISGERFLRASRVNFGAAATGDFTLVDDNTITVRLPETTADGTVTVTVTTDSGTGGSSPNSDFSYVFPVPVIQSINPPRGNVAGGDSVNINGLGFTGAIAVGFGNASVTPVVVGDTQIAVTTPAVGRSGAVDVVVTTQGGASAPGRFVYVFPTPVITGIFPDNGPPDGGTPVTISGSGFTGASQVSFGDVQQPFPFQFVDDTQITVLSPAATASGPVSITVTSFGGTSAITSVSQFTYI